jgi:hypothetical protein
MWFCVNAFLLMFTGSFMQFMHAQFLANALIFHADPLNRKLLLNIKSCSSKTFKHITALIAHYKGGTKPSEESHPEPCSTLHVFDGWL